MNLLGLMTRRVRGFRVVDLVALTLVLILALAVYAFKTSAGAEGADIIDVKGQIRLEQRDVRLLAAEVAQLEAPQRLERLARAYASQAPIEARQEVTPDSLPTVAQPGGAP